MGMGVVHGTNREMDARCKMGFESLSIRMDHWEGGGLVLTWGPAGSLPVCSDPSAGAILPAGEKFIFFGLAFSTLAPTTSLSFWHLVLQKWPRHSCFPGPGNLLTSYVSVHTFLPGISSFPPPPPCSNPILLSKRGSSLAPSYLSHSSPT